MRVIVIHMAMISPRVHTSIHRPRVESSDLDVQQWRTLDAILFALHRKAQIRAHVWAPESDYSEVSRGFPLLSVLIVLNMSDASDTI